MPFSGFITNPILQTPLIPAPPRAPQPELINYSKTPQISTQPINVAHTNKTSSSEKPQLIHTDFNIDDVPLSSQFCSSKSSQIEKNLVNPPQRPVTNIEP